MDNSKTIVLHEAAALLSSAERFERYASDRDLAAWVPQSLVFVEEAFHALGRAFDNAADPLVPPVAAHETNSSRYARAAANWPGVTGVAAPSYEEHVRRLSTLHDARTALSAAAKGTARARTVPAEKVSPHPGHAAFADRQVDGAPPARAPA
jgi:hypothetical protein